MDRDRVSHRALASCALLLALATPAIAADFSVDYQIDAPDVDVGDGVCADRYGYCTLRAAVQEANAQPGQQTIALGPIVHYLAIWGPGEDEGATGDLDVAGDLVVEGVSAATTILRAETIDRFFDVKAGVSLMLADLTIENAQSYDAGGGLRAADGALVMLARTVFDHDAALYSGGAIALDGDAAGGATLLGVDSRFHANRAGVDLVSAGAGGAIHAQGHAAIHLVDCTLDANVAGEGAALWSAQGAVTLERSTISGHVSEGAIVRLANAEPVRVENVTIDGNTSELAVWHAGGGATTTFENATITGNVAPYVLLNVYFPPLAELRLRNSVLFDAPTLAECTGVTSLGHNAIAAGAMTASCATWAATDLLLADPLLAPLADNGGSTPTRMPRPASPLRDAGDDAHCPALDQRRVSRPQDGDADGDAHCDIGAVEAPEPHAAALGLAAAASIAAVARRRRG